MSNSDSIIKAQAKSTELGHNVVSKLLLETRDNHRIVLKRPLPEAKDLLGFRSYWNKEFELGQQLKHPNLLRYMEMEEDAMIMEKGNYISLDQFLYENPSFVTNSSEVERIINEILNALNYLHTQGIYQYDLTPHSILLTRSGKSVKLMGACSFYEPLRFKLWPSSTEYAAPELREENAALNAKTDIYAVGKVIEFIFSFCKIPYRYAAVIKRATKIDPQNRYESIRAMKSVINRREIFRKSRNILISIACAALLVGAYFWISEEYTDEPMHHVDPVNNANEPFSVIETRSKYALNEDSLAIYYNDSLFTAEDEKEWNDTVLTNKLDVIFRRQFRHKADAILGKIYNQQMMNGTQRNFQIAATQCFEDLKRVEEELIEKNGIDPIRANKIATEIISTVTDQYLSRIK